MSVLQVYLNWVNSVLSGHGNMVCTGVATIQEGKVICQLIDALCPDADLQHKVQESGLVSNQSYLRTALDHMRSHGIKFHFTPQDWKKWMKNVLDGDIKSILDILWLIILNYGVHIIGSSPYQRSVGIGKKLLLDWCQRELGVEFDPQNSLTHNLCSGDWFLKLLAKSSGAPLSGDDREQNLKRQLAAIEHKYGIKQALISPSDITEGTADEHTLMIYISLLRLKIGDSVDLPERSSRESSPQASDKVSTVKEVPVIVLSKAGEERSTSFSPPRPGSPNSSPTQSPPRKRSPETDPETSDWLSQSSESPISSYHEKLSGPHTPDILPEVESLIKETISKHIEAAISPSAEGMQKQENHSAHGSRIPVRVKQSDESHGTSSSPTRVEIDKDGPVSSRKISIKVQRPRSPNSIMAEARARQEQERERRKREKDEHEKLKKRESEKDETAMTGSASEGGEMTELGARLKHDIDPLKSDDEDIVKPKSSVSLNNIPDFARLNGDAHNGVPVFVMPGKKHDMELLLEALRHARTEASVQDQLIQSGPSDDPEFKQVIDKNIEQLEAQLAAVKAQSKEIFNGPEKRPDESNGTRGRKPSRETSRRSPGRSPPRGILDLMANQDIRSEETSPKEREDEQTTPHGILRNRMRSPTDHARRFTEDSERVREGSTSPDKRRSVSPYHNGHERDLDQDPDKRLIKFLTNEIENMKLKMAVMEQKSAQRSLSPYSAAPRVTSGLPDRERDRSPAQISSRARARFSEYGTEGSYSPTRRARSTDLIDEIRSRSPRFESPSRSLSRSPARSPVGVSRSRTPELYSRERIRPVSPSARVLSLQDLSTSITDDIDGNLTFSPASGARPVNLGYSSPIRKVNDEIWGHGQTEEEYYADTAKYDSWKRLISRETVTDEDSLELKQALASALVELNIVTAKLKNANSDIKDKMAKTSDVLNDCRAQISKSQAENAELRSQIEREKTKAESQEMRIKEMEKNLHSAKTSQDDKTLDLEESVMTLKGIINLDKTQMTQLEEENDKLRKRISEFQRENIKLREIASYALKDFNELKIYNDKAQQTIKDLKTCLEDARTERTQFVTEIKKLKEQGMNNKINSIVNTFVEKGIYEDAEKDHLVERSRARSPSPVRFNRPRSTSPVFSRPVTPLHSISPIHKPDLSYTMSYTPMSRSQTPIPSSFNFEDVSPDDGRPIYPHRRTLSYMKKFGSHNDVSATQVDLNDPEIQELLKPKGKLEYDLDLNDNQYKEEKESQSEKRKLLYSPYMDKDFIPKSGHSHYEKDYENEKPSPESKSSPAYFSTSQRKSSIEDDWESKQFIQALDSAVKQTPAQLANQRFLQELDRSSTGEHTSPDRWRSPSKGILKNTKMAQNMSIKESMPLKRSMESRSYSPAVRSGTYSPRSPRSFTPESRSYSSPSPVRSYGASTPQARSYSPATERTRSQSPRTMAQRSYSPGSTALSPGDRFRSNPMRDSGYSTPTYPRTRNPESRDYASGPKTPTRQNNMGPSCGLLSEEERRYADLLIEKYTRQHIKSLAISSS
ncbi:hypothetical protein DPMN_017013 [Dreissena polymorpha]|uniref:Calponin-homology (CH) domain-containing protein n=1 Tax=Dreissena polymorpha TaxID=45954 RepID=A0A9D4NCD2_DREPO|nr:hypothetical protein DPMN_017013 [Dreissena polymorpha]